MDADQRERLLAAQLAGLVRARAGDAEREPAPFPGGAALVEGTTGWLLLDADPIRSFGPALVWADRRGLTDVSLVVDGEAGIVARRAQLFSPPPLVWVAAGTTLEPAEPAPLATVAEPTSAPALAELLVDADLEVVVESGIVRGEVLGLEVARIVHGTTTAGEPIDAPVLEVGVGEADREMTGMVHGNLPSAAQLARVIEIVQAQRRPGAEHHPLNQMAPERWLRALLVADPSRIGLRHLRAAPPAVARPNLRDRAVAIAQGVDADDQPVVVACSVGVDLDLVPAAAYPREALDPDARLLLVVPERDAHPVTHALAARLARPAEVVAIEGDWRQWGPATAAPVA
ncbi:MAG: hypothetical protein ACSLFP_03780 [Acidimicrobiales bacterium]